MSAEQITVILAERVMGWTACPERFMMGRRRWTPRWRFQPASRLEDASRLLEHAATEEYTSGASANGGFWARVRIGGVIGEAAEPTQARAITFAIARAIGLEVDSIE